MALVLAAGGLCVPATAQTPAPADPAANITTIAANLNISPKRVTFDRNTRSTTVYIFNQGTAPASFDISLIDRMMLPDGQIMPVEDAANKPELGPVLSQVKSAKAMLQASPRRATLEPGKGQTIRIRALPGADLADGEYRTHLTVTTIPPRDIGLTAEQASSGAPGELRFTVNSVFGISIPAIVRIGEPDVRAGIENVKIDYAEVSPDGVAPPRRTAFAVIDLVRGGPNSLFGNVEIKAPNEKEPIGVARGVGVYTEIPRRTMRIPLNRAPKAGEKLEISFTDDDTAPGKLLAKHVYSAP